MIGVLTMLGNKEKITNTTDDANKNTDAKSSNIAFYSKIALSALAGAAAIYYGGPLAAVTARTVFDSYYEHQYGALPSLLSTDYWKIYMPMREHIGATAYKYGPQGFGAISAFVAYKTSQAIGWATHKITSKTSSAPMEQTTSSDLAKDQTSITPHEELLIKPAQDAPLLEIKVEQAPLVEMDDKKLDDELEDIIKKLMALDLSADKEEAPAKEYTMADLEKEFENLTLLFAHEQKSEIKTEIKPENISLEQHVSPEKKSLTVA